MFLGRMGWCVRLQRVVFWREYIRSQDFSPMFVWIKPLVDWRKRKSNELLSSQKLLPAPFRKEPPNDEIENGFHFFLL